MATDNQANREQSATTIAAQRESARPITSVALVQSRSRYDPAAALPQKLVKRTLKLEFVEMSELIPDTWHEDGHTARGRTHLAGRG